MEVQHNDVEADKAPILVSEEEESLSIFEADNMQHECGSQCDNLQPKEETSQVEGADGVLNTPWTNVIVWQFP